MNDSLSAWRRPGAGASGAASWGPNVRLIILIILILLVIGALPTWPYSAGWAFTQSGDFERS